MTLVKQFHKIDLSLIENHEIWLKAIVSKSFVIMQYLRRRTKNKQTSRTIGRIKYAGTMQGHVIIRLWLFATSCKSYQSFRENGTP